jgi:hypothetical protein
MFGRCSAGPLIHDIGEVSTGPVAQETVFPVRTARVAVANYGAIIHDFPQVFGDEARRERPLIGCDACTSAGRLCREAVNDWLIRNAAFISEAQAKPNAVNSPIEVGEGVRTGFRPPSYGRGIVVPIDSPAQQGQAGFLDVKGAGVRPGRIPTHEPYSSGLEYLGYALADFFYGWLIDSIFARYQPSYHVLPVYAILDFGFDIVGGWHGTGPAGVHVRRAHARPDREHAHPMAGSDEEKLVLHIELMLRLFGLTSTGAGTAFAFLDPTRDDLEYHGLPIEVNSAADRQQAAAIAAAIRASRGDRLEMINVQSTSATDWDRKTFEMLDFGNLNAFRDFSNPVGNMVRNAALHVGRIISPGQASFVRPDPLLAVDADLCDRHSVNAYGFYAAQAFRGAGSSFSQRKIERLLRIGRMKALRRDTGWAHRRAAEARAFGHAQAPWERGCRPIL